MKKRHNFLPIRKAASWQEFNKSPEYYAWRGNAFETVCLNHIGQIKYALGISGITSNEYSWRSKKKDGGVQIDLLIDRKDDMINLCEIKYTDRPFSVTKKYKDELLKKTEIFTEETRTKKTVHLTLITSNGLKQNENSEVVQNLIDAEALFDI